MSATAGGEVRADRSETGRSGPGPAAHSQMIFINLPVADLDASRRFFTRLGYSFDERFCDGTTLCVVISDTIFVMLLQRDFFAGFTPRAVADAHVTSEAVLCLSAASRADVDRLVGGVGPAGGTELRTVRQENPDGVTFMYGRSYADLDGHIWEVLWMDPTLA